MSVKRVVPAISKLDDFQKALPCFLDKSTTLALLLDFDGTLAPIVENPSSAAMSPELEKTLRKLAKHPKIFVGIISGRGIEDVKNKVGIEGISYAGNHGFEIQNSDGTRHDYEMPKDMQNSYKQLVQELNEKVAKNGAWIEDKTYSLTYHYRDATGHELDELKAMTKEIIERYGFKANQAMEAIEAKPPVDWNKGEAARYILERNFGPDWESKIKVIFVGDDTTDEDAMKALQGIGKTFRISIDPKIETYADYRFPCQEVINELMKWICCSYA